MKGGSEVDDVTQLILCLMKISRIIKKMLGLARFVSSSGLK
jgi:hypothetical protein